MSIIENSKLDFKRRKMEVFLVIIFEIEKNLVCFVCLKRFKIVEILKSYYFVYCKIKEFECEICKLVF